MARCIVVFLLELALAGCGTMTEPLSSAASLQQNPIIDQVVEFLREQSKEEPNPADIVGALNLIVVTAYRQGNYTEAAVVAEVTLNYAEQELGTEHPTTLYSYNNLATLYQSQGRYGEAEPLSKGVLAVREQVLGAEHPDTLKSVNNLAMLYHAQGRYEEAEPLFKRALAVHERELGPEHPSTLTSVNNLAGLYFAQGRYGEAEPLLKRALAASRRVLGARHTDTLESVNNLAGLYLAQGRYGEAEPLFKRALTAHERELGPEHPSTLNSVNNLAWLYQSQGRYGEAEMLLKRALAARGRVLGPEHPDTLASVQNLAVLYHLQGRYGEAEPLFKRAMAASERLLGPEHPSTLNSVNNLARLYHDQGRYEEAEPLFKRALAAHERVLGAEHPDTLVSINNLARLYHDQRRYEEAELLFKRALAAHERVLGAEHPNTLNSLNNLATLYQSQGRYGEAEPLFKHALAANRRVLGPEHPSTLRSTNNVAWLYHVQGRYGEAEPLFKRALVANERVLGTEHPDTLRVQMNLAVVLVIQGKHASALRELRRLDNRLRAFVGLQLATTEKERVRRRLLTTESTLQNVAFTLAVRYPGPDTARLAADILLRWKRLAGEEEAVVARLARTSQDPRVVELAQQIRVGRERLSRLVHLPESDATTIAKQRAELERLEAKLAGLSRAFRGQLVSRSVEWESVQGALPPGAALLELRAYQPMDFKRGEPGNPHWLALLIPADPGAGPALRVTDLGPVADSSPVLAALRSGDTTAAKAAYESLFGKLDIALAEYETLYLAPDGLLDLVAFNRLVLPDGRYWIERQAVRQVRSGRDLLPDPTTGEAAGMVVFGGVDYERFADAEEAAGGLQHSETTANEPDLSADLQRSMNQRLRAERGNFAKLKHTAPEARTVARYYWDYYNRKAQVHIGVAASEVRLKTLEPPPRVLHLATHGFFLESRRTYTERPLTLAGLALAGANRGLEGELDPVSAHDGILYALEAQDLNLEGTALVTLSACDTGRGEVDYSEGVYGLVRSFQIAGAENVMMTLWSLNDPLAEAFMADFYRRWFGPNDYESPAEALRATQLVWLGSDEPRRQDPTYWAPYVLVERR